MREYIIAAAGIAGGFIVSALGGWDMALQTLIIFMAIDCASGLLLAAHCREISSKRSFEGLAKKGMCLLIVLLGHRLDLYMGLDFVRTAVIIAFAANELISITENAGLMGVPIPAAVKKAVELLNVKGDSKSD
jgi:toxin secretion/phage lysis holin